MFAIIRSCASWYHGWAIPILLFTITNKWDDKCWIILTKWILPTVFFQSSYMSKMLRLSIDSCASVPVCWWIYLFSWSLSYMLMCVKSWFSLFPALAILLSCFIYGHSIGMLGILGIIVVFIALFGKIYLGQRFKAAKARQAAATPSSTKGWPIKLA